MMNLTVSGRAADELKKAIAEHGTAAGTESIRVFVQSQCGCGSAHFGMGFDDPEEEDNRIDVNGVTLLVDPQSAPFLENAEVDFSDDLMGQGFRINAPSAAGGCGCGGGHGHGHQH